MVKRMIMDLGAVPPILRISKPGIAVSTSTPATDLMLDERVLYGQVFISGLASRINYGNTETLNVTIPDQGFVPFVEVWGLTGGTIVNPAAFNSSGAIYDVYWTQTATQISFVFQDFSSVTAVYYQVLRLPRS